MNTNNEAKIKEVFTNKKFWYIFSVLGGIQLVLFIVIILFSKNEIWLITPVAHIFDFLPRIFGSNMLNYLYFNPPHKYYAFLVYGISLCGMILNHLFISLMAALFSKKYINSNKFYLYYLVVFLIIWIIIRMLILEFILVRYSGTPY